MRAPLLYVAASMILTSLATLGQTSSTEASFSVSVRTGLSFSNSTNWNFRVISASAIDDLMRPGPAVSLGLDYGPFLSLAGLDLRISAETGYGSSAPHSLVSQYSSIEGGIEQVPVILSLILSEDARFSPFVQIGCGVCRTDYRYFYTVYGQPLASYRVRFHIWQFAWSGGAGLKYQLTRTFAAILMVGATFTLADLEQSQRPNLPDGLPGPVGLISTCVGITVDL